MFKTDRLYSAINPVTGRFGWYFQSREGDSGPYHTRAEADNMLKEYVEECIETGNTGSRESVGPRIHGKFELNKRKPNFCYRGKIRWHD